MTKTTRLGSRLAARVLASSLLINTAVLTGSSVAILEGGPVIKGVFLELFEKEGEGDKVTTVPTGNVGVTRGAVRAVGGSGDMGDMDVAVHYLNVLHERWGRVEGYSEAPIEVKEALLDLSYNLGEGVFSYQGLRSALRARDYLEVMRQTLDTANVDGKSVKGLAIRRVDGYNKVAKDDIFWIKQQEDGTMLYATFDSLVMKYTPRGGKHEKSVAGTVVVQPDPRGMF